MRIINDVEFSADDINEYKNIIYMNIIKGKQDSIILSALGQKVYYAKAANHSFSSFIPCIGLQVLVVGRKQLNIALVDSQLEAEGNKLILFDAFSIVDSDNFSDLHDLFAMLWEDPGIKETFKRRSEIQVIDSIGYYLDNLDRICRPEYLPSNQDILHARKTTQSIVECQIQIDNVEFHFTDVGGQVR